jgi:flagellar hook assembly protein FlgD
MVATPGASNFVTDVQEEIIPGTFSLGVYPNPFNPVTTIQYTIPERSEVEFKIYDILGNEVWKHSLSEREAGTYKLEWSGINNAGIKVSSGIYILNFSAGEFSKSFKMMLMK